MVPRGQFATGPFLQLRSSWWRAIKPSHVSRLGRRSVVVAGASEGHAAEARRCRGLLGRARLTLPPALEHNCCPVVAFEQTAAVGVSSLSPPWTRGRAMACGLALPTQRRFRGAIGTMPASATVTAAAVRFLASTKRKRGTCAPFCPKAPSAVCEGPVRCSLSRTYEYSPSATSVALPMFRRQSPILVVATGSNSFLHSAALEAGQ